MKSEDMERGKMCRCNCYDKLPFIECLLCVGTMYMCTLFPTAAHKVGIIHFNLEMKNYLEKRD